MFGAYMGKLGQIARLATTSRNPAVSRRTATKYRIGLRRFHFAVQLFPERFKVTVVESKLVSADCNGESTA